MIEHTQLFKCLSDETRLQVSLLIYLEGELCVCELVEVLQDSQPKISRHLAQLRNCGILEDVRRGQWVFYSLSNRLPQWAIDILKLTASTNPTALKRLQSNLRNMKNRPQCC